MKFEDERRPLYKLCRKLVLDRIDSAHYQNHLNKAATAQWNESLSDEVLSHIMSVTERHPYYMNYLCDELWSESETIPTAAQVKKAWENVVEEERSDALKDFFSLSENQRKLMVYLANYGGENIYSADAAKKMGIAITSISKALHILTEKDYVEKIGDHYRLIVPVYKQLLKSLL